MNDRSGCRVAVLRINDIHRDPRVNRAAQLLLERGNEVRVYTILLPDESDEENLNGMKVVRLSADHAWEGPEPFEAAFDPKITHIVRSIWHDLYSVAKAVPAASPVVTADMTEMENQPNQKKKRSLLDRWRSFPKRNILIHVAKRVVPASIRKTVKGYFLTQMAAYYKLPAAPQPVDPSSQINIDRRETLWRLQFNVDLFQKIGSWATHVYCCDLDTLFAGVMLKRAYGVKLIYDAYEIWPHQWAEDYRSAQFTGFYSVMERLMLPYTDGRLTVGEGLARYFEAAYASQPFTVSPSTPCIKYLVPEKVLARKTTRRGILYHGSYTPQRGLEEIIDVVPLLDDCRVAFRGVGEHEIVLRRLVKEKGLEDRIEFLAPVGVDRLVKTASEFDIGLLPFVNSCLNTNYAFPNKLFEYMMAGLALASTDLVDQTRVIRQYEMGVVFDIGNKQQVADQINRLLRNPDELDRMRRNAWTAARDQFNWENSRSGMIRVLESCGL